MPNDSDYSDQMTSPTDPENCRYYMIIRPSVPFHVAIEKLEVAQRRGLIDDLRLRLSFKELDVTRKHDSYFPQRSILDRNQYLLEWDGILRIAFPILPISLLNKLKYSFTHADLYIILTLLTMGECHMVARIIGGKPSDYAIMTKTRLDSNKSNIPVRSRLAKEFHVFQRFLNSRLQHLENFKRMKYRVIEQTVYQMKVADAPQKEKIHKNSRKTSENTDAKEKNDMKDMTDCSDTDDDTSDKDRKKTKKKRRIISRRTTSDEEEKNLEGCDQVDTVPISEQGVTVVYAQAIWKPHIDSSQANFIEIATLSDAYRLLKANKSKINSVFCFFSTEDVEGSPVTIQVIRKLQLLKTQYNQLLFVPPAPSQSKQYEEICHELAQVMTPTTRMPTIDMPYSLFTNGRVNSYIMTGYARNGSYTNFGRNSVVTFMKKFGFHCFVYSQSQSH